ncbi:MAG: GGDEF domain-containing protein [Nitrosomonadales bacterium]
MASNKRRGVYGGVLFMDLDKFKPLNDTYGHVIGDLLLIEVGRRIKSCIREADTVARFGGDEFVVMLGELKLTKPHQEMRPVTLLKRFVFVWPRLISSNLKGGTAESCVEHSCSSSIGVTLFSGH